MFVCSAFGNGIGVSRNKQQRLMFKTLFSGELPEEKLDEPSADDQGKKNKNNKKHSWPQTHPLVDFQPR